MFAKRSIFPLAFLAIVEYFLLCVAFFASFLQMGEFSLSEASAWYSALSVLLLCLMVQAMMFALGLYSWNVGASSIDVFQRLIAAFTLGFLVYGAVQVLISVLTIPTGIIVLALGLALPVVWTMRYTFLRIMNLARTKSQVLILGTGAQAANLMELEARGQASRFVITHFVELEDMVPSVETDKIIAMPEQMGDFIAQHAIDEIVVAMEERRGKLPLKGLIDARLHGASVVDYQTFCERALGHIRLEALRPSWFFHSNGFRSSALRRVVKRSIDILLSLGLLVFTLPLLVLTAIAIKLESPGGIFYTQERVGLGGQSFTLFKFRSMRHDAEAGGKAQWARKNDPRVTRVGAIIRKTRIDEIPQIINVLKGDMSFVGPRPERPMFVDELSDQIPYYHERHRVRPGITGWAQVNYPYGASLEDAKRKLEYDLYYIKYASILFDLSIALQTVRVIIWSDGAR